jgi:hypothetical protein
VSAREAPPRSYGPRVESAEVKRSRRAAMLQLYGLENWTFMEGSSDLVVELKWTIPLIAGIVVAIVALYVKWEPYVADKEEPHFIMSIAALVVPAMLLALMFLKNTDRILFGTPNWLYPVSLLGISLTEISLAMTWEGTSRRKTISIAAAVFPIAIMSFPLIYHPATEIILASIHLRTAT